MTLVRPFYGICRGGKDDALVRMQRVCERRRLCTGGSRAQRGVSAVGGGRRGASPPPPTCSPTLQEAHAEEGSPRLPSLSALVRGHAAELQADFLRIAADP